MTRKSDPEPPLRLPIRLDPVSNGEFVPDPATPEIRRVQQHAFERAAELARKKGVSRRTFLQSTCGAATVLATMNQVLGCGGANAAGGAGGRYAVPPEAELDEAAAQAAVGGEEFIFDVQTHRVAVDRDWWERNDVFHDLASSRGACGEDWMACYTTDHYLKEVFLDSDTDVAVLSAVPGGEGKTPLLAREAAETRETAERMDGTGRLLIHGLVQPEVYPMEQVLEHMDELHEQWRVAGWKAYPVWGADGTGWWLDDEATGMRVLERARDLGVRAFAVHKGLPQPGMDPTYTRPRDVGPAARAFPEVQFLIYHSGYEHDVREGPYDPNATRGVDALIRSVEEAGIGPGGNVYAEMGVLWRQLRNDPTQAAHVLGKMLHLGEDRVLWGTDSIWFGSPQDQIQSFRAFEIDERLQEEHGYPALTPERKAKILGLNAAPVYDVDPTAYRGQPRASQFNRARETYRAEPQPTFADYGPRTRRDVLRLLGRG